LHIPKAASDGSASIQNIQRKLHFMPQFGVHSLGTEFGVINTTAEPERVSGEIVSGNYFDVPGVKANIGRTLNSDDDRTRVTDPLTFCYCGTFCFGIAVGVLLACSARNEGRSDDRSVTNKRLKNYGYSDTRL
jgi:hypothetical protein